MTSSGPPRHVATWSARKHTRAMARHIRSDLQSSRQAGTLRISEAATLDRGMVDVIELAVHLSAQATQHPYVRPRAILRKLPTMNAALSTTSIKHGDGLLRLSKALGTSPSPSVGSAAKSSHSEGTARCTTRRPEAIRLANAVLKICKGLGTLPIGVHRRASAAGPSPSL